MRRWSHILGSVLLQAAALFWPAAVPAADFPSAERRAAPAPAVVAPSYAYDPNRFEIRFGALAHGVGSWETGTVDLSADFVTPRLWAVPPVWWDLLVPRLRLGGVPGQYVQLGCRTLFHAGGSIGFVPIPKWSVIATFEHLSNGNSLFGTGCSQNQGLNNYGVKIGYSF